MKWLIVGFLFLNYIFYRVFPLAKLNLYTHRFSAMGTVCEIQYYADGESLAKTVANSVVGDIARLEQRYSRYKNDSFLAEINRCAAEGKSIEVDEETASLLNYAATCYEQSGGLFDITSGVLRKVWRFIQEQATLPNQEQIDSILQYVGWEKLNWQSPRLSFSCPGMELDFGGIVKEYAADRAASICLAMGVNHGIVNLGGDIKVIGCHPDQSPWRVGIRDPKKKEAIANVVELYNGGMASSGDYERCVEIDGKRYGHILNPKTGWPVQYFASVTVISDFCVLAGSASTITMLKEQQGLAWLNELNLPCLWIDVDGNVGGTLGK